MRFETGDEVVDRALEATVRQLATGGEEGAPLLSRKRTIRESAFYDFSSYQFLFEPTRLTFPADPDPGGSIPGTAKIPVDVWLDFEEFVSGFQVAVQGPVERVLLVEGTKIAEEQSDYTITYESIMEERRIADNLVIDGSQAFRLGMAPLLFGAYRATSESERFLGAAQKIVSAWADSRLQEMRRGTTFNIGDLQSFGRASYWRDGANSVLAQLAGLEFKPIHSGDGGGAGAAEFGEALPASFPFDPFQPDSVNFGLQVVYRQGWTPLGTQPGEIVRTLPLGPKQSEKVQAKAIRRTKSTRQAEISTSVESSTESSAATKDSSEVVQEASESFNWHVEASASASFGFGGGSMKAGMGGENASSSRDTKSSLSEAMEKTASKIRRDTKIIVTTESEETSEFSRMSEISNPNDEIAVTYIYSRLQRQYEIATYLSEVNMVVFVAEQIPAPHEIDGPWVRRYDWILGRELLDESYRSDLDAIRGHTVEQGAEGNRIDANIRKMMEAYSAGENVGIPDYSQVPGTIPDMFRFPQEAYEREVERQRAMDADDEQYLRSLRRLRAHIYDNILHYCRAIWSSEDPDARLLRYSRIRVPTVYEAIPSGGVDEGGAGVTLSPSVSDVERDTAPLSEVINPAGPIGFVGNYAVFYLKESPRWQTLTNLIDGMVAPYRRLVVRVERDQLPQAVSLRAVASPYREGEGTYRIVRIDDDQSPFEVRQRADDGSYTPLGASAVSFDGRALRFHAVRIEIESYENIAAGDEFSLVLTLLPVLEDPELKAIRWSQEPLDPGVAEIFFATEVISEMRSSFAAVSRALRGVAADAAWADVDASQREVLLDHYFDYLLRSKYIRRLLVDTNNVLLTREVDDAATLEPYKEVHRLLDALGAVEDIRQKATESARRQKRVDADSLGDPDIERVTVVAASKHLEDLAALDGLDDHGGEDGGDDPSG